MRYIFYIFIHIFLCKKKFFSVKKVFHKKLFFHTKRFFSANNVYLVKNKIFFQKNNFFNLVLQQMNNHAWGPTENFMASNTFLFDYLKDGECNLIKTK